MLLYFCCMYMVGEYIYTNIAANIKKSLYSDLSVRHCLLSRKPPLVRCFFIMSLFCIKVKVNIFLLL